MENLPSNDSFQHKSNLDSDYIRENGGVNQGKSLIKRIGLICNIGIFAFLIIMIGMISYDMLNEKSLEQQHQQLFASGDNQEEDDDFNA